MKHLEAHAQRAVVGSLVLRAALHDCAALADRGRAFADLLHTLDGWVEGRCAHELNLPDDETSVTDFLGRLVDDFAREVEGAVAREEAPVREAFQKLVAHVRERVDELRASDTDPVRWLDSWARSTTKAWYRAVVEAIDGRVDAAPTTVAFSRMECPQDATAPWCVAGRTEFPPRGPALGVEVEFGPTPDWKTWSAAPYVLLHELTSHVAQGPWTVECRQPRDSDPFAEGWMDVVAVRIHNLSAAGGGPADVPELPDWPDHRAAANGVHAERRVVRPGAWRRTHGMDVAERLEAHMQIAQADPHVAERLEAHMRIVQADPEGEERFLRLSMHVNVSAASADTRTSFVWGVEEALARTAAGAAMHDGATLADWLTTYRGDGDVESLIAHFVALADDAAGRAAKL